MILDAEALIEKHRGKGVLVDANLLVLLLVGTVNPARIPLFKRTQNFTIEDFRLLEILINWFGPHLFSTPHVLSQASDLIDLKGKEGLLARQAADLDRHLALQARNLDTLNFNHMRALELS